MGGGDEVGGMGNPQAAGGNIHARLLQGFRLALQRQRVDDHAAAQHCPGVGVNDAGGDQMQLENRRAHRHRVTGIVAAVEAAHQVRPGGKQVHHAALAFIPPLGSKHNFKRHANLRFAGMAPLYREAGAPRRPTARPCMFQRSRPVPAKGC